MVTLRRAALHCGFRDLDDILLDQLADLTLQMVIDKAQATNLSNLSAAEIQGVSIRGTIALHHNKIDPKEVAKGENDINLLRTAKGKGWVSETKPWQLKAACVGCGNNYSWLACKFKNAVCQRCQKKGHLARVCWDIQLQTNPLPTKHSRNHND
ncbi:hypothetical protein E2320_002491 [Naja naja]|nr:hypothetical protein E2320_002491 [Naja naja]